MVSTYRHSLRRVVYKCTAHGRFSALPSNVEAGHGCARCARDRQRTKHTDHVAAVRRIHGNRLRVVGTYRAANIRLTYACIKHGNFKAKPANVVHRRSGCRRCFNASVGCRLRKSHETYSTEAGRLGVIVVDRYDGALTPIRHRCPKGHVWSTPPNQLLSGYGCPLCDMSQYRRRPIKVGRRTAWVQGAEGVAVVLLLAEGHRPSDLAFTAPQGKPSFRYRFQGRIRRYTPDVFVRSSRQIIEVKSPVTLGLYDRNIFAQVRAKAQSVIDAGFSLRLMVIHRGQNIDLGPDWYRLSWRVMTRRLRRQSHAQDRRRTKDRRTGRP